MVDSRVFPYRTVVVFAADPGEANDVRVTWLPDSPPSKSVVINDAGAALKAGNQCRALDVHTVQCTPLLSPTAYLIHADVELGDRNDQVRVGAPSSGGPRFADGVLFANGGVGDDVLDARNVFMARLDGGGGRDHLYGAAMESLLMDGDRDGAKGDAAPGPDVIDGGPGVPDGGGDTLSYRQRTAPVIVDLADGKPEGERGEGDVVRGVESLDGGSGDDRLAGDGHNNLLNGGGGRDVLIGRAGNDALGVVTGTWVSEPPSAKRDERRMPPPSAAGDVVSCGSGRDWVNMRRTSDFTPMSCEAIRVRRPLPESIGGKAARTSVDPYPALVGRALEYRFACSYDDDWEWEDWAKLRCHGRVELRESAPKHRLLAVGRLRSSTGRWTGTMEARLRFTALGRARYNHGHKVKAQVSFQGRYVPTSRWTISLTGRRGA